MSTRQTVTIRPARIAEVEQVVHMFEWLFAPPGTRPPRWEARRAVQALRRAISSDAAVVLIAECEGRLVGVGTVYDDFESVRFGRRAWVEDLAVDPARRSLGIGKLLLDAAKDWGRARGATRLELESAEARADAHRFYQRETPSWRSECFGWEL
jgi:GNAT superfamily N-acetyltransferase